MVAIAFISSLLFASAALAAPNSRLGARLARRREGRQSQPLAGAEPQGLVPQTGNSSHAEYSTNWAGAVWDTYPSVRYIHRIYVKPEDNYLCIFI